MKTNTTMAQPKKMNSRELLASKLKDIVSTNKQSVEQIDGNSWRFKGVEVDSELGEYKKEYLYKIIHGLTTTKMPRMKLSKDHRPELFEMRDYIKDHKADFTLDGNTLTGKVPQGEFKLVVGNLKPMKNGHKRVFGSKLFINGELYHEGGSLFRLMRAFQAKKRGKKPKTEQAEAKKA